MFVVDDLLMAPARGLFWIFQEIHQAAQEEMVADAESITAELSALYMRLETGKLTEEEFAAEEKRPARAAGQDTQARQRNRIGAPGQESGAKAVKGGTVEECVTRTSDTEAPRFLDPRGLAATHLRRKRRCRKNHLRDGRGACDWRHERRNYLSCWFRPTRRTLSPIAWRTWFRRKT